MNFLLQDEEELQHKYFKISDFSKDIELVVKDN